MDAHPTAKRCVVALDRWLPLIPFVCYPVLLCLLNVRLFRLLGSQRQAALDLTAVIARTVFVPGLTFWGGTILRDRLNLPRPYEQPGFEPLRRQVAIRMRDAGVVVDPSEVVITHGCVDAIHMALRVMTQPGDLIAAESPTYYGLLQLAEVPVTLVSTGQTFSAVAIERLGAPA